MFELPKNAEIEHFISITKSDSGVSGPELAKAHFALGQEMGKHLVWLPQKDTTIVAMLRGGIFFAEGLYFSLCCKFDTYDPKNQKFVRPETKYVILVDSVINTGKTISKIIGPDMLVACCVINEGAIPLFDSQLFTVRVSKNSFVGEKMTSQKGSVGPDTTMRLFNQI